MVGRGGGRGVRGNQNQQVEVAELRQMIEDLSRAVQALQCQERVGAHMENPEGDHGLLDIPEGRADNSVQKRAAADLGVRCEKTAQKFDQGVAIASKNSNSEKRKEIAGLEGKYIASSGYTKSGSSSQIRCFTCGERGHTSYACPKKRVNLIEVEDKEEEFSQPVFDDSGEDDQKVDVLPVEGESLVREPILERGEDLPREKESPATEEEEDRDRVWCWGSGRFLHDSKVEW
ncbi:hypothetical protein ACOSQ4_004154 [Xanthoceras sorbifolium]